MDAADQVTFDRVLGAKPYALCSRHFSAVTRPRLWWTSEPPELPGDTAVIDRGNHLELSPLVARVPWEEVLLPGWRPCGVPVGAQHAR